MNENEIIKRRIFNCVNKLSVEMYELINLFDIRFDNKIDSAAVSCSTHPILYLNKDFINKYCQTDEHLLMLILHEIYHILLAHTTLFKTNSMIDNIVFDSIINALLCRLFKEDRYVSFFKNINDSSLFPSCLLRPKDHKTPSKYIKLLDSLYTSNTTTYYEIYRILLDNILDVNNINYMLIGDHSNTNISNPIMNKIIDKIVQKWPKEFVDFGIDKGDKIDKEKVDNFINNKDNYKKMKRLLNKAGINEVNSSNNSFNTSNISQNSLVPILNYKDRYKYTKDKLLPNNLLYNNEMVDNRMSKNTHKITLVYLDVSGSIKKELNTIFPLLLDAYKHKNIKLYAFSTVVKNISYKDFKNGNYESTFGTDINCVFNHYLEENIKYKSKKILILTDGYVGNIIKIIKEEIIKNKLEIYVGYFGKYTKSYMDSYVKESEEF